MTGRILGIELRRSPAVPVALLSAALGIGLLATGARLFEGRWMQLAVTGRFALLLLLPLALAGGASVGRREAAHRVGELFASTGRPRWQRVLPTAAAFALAIPSAYLLVVLGGAPWVAPTSRYFPTAAIAVTAVGALSLVAAGWLGMAAGRAVPRLVTAPALAVVGAAVAGVLPILAGQPAPWEPAAPPPAAAWLLTPIHNGNIDDFQTIAARVTATQALWLVALAVTGLLLLGAVTRRAVALAVLPAGLGLAVALALLPAGGYAAAADVDPAAAELVCDDDGAQVCTGRVHAYLLPDIAPPARRALALLAERLPDAPTRAVEIVEPRDWARSDDDPAPVRHPADVLAFDLGSQGITDRADYAAPAFLSFLVESAWMQGCAAADDFVFRDVSVAWVTGDPATLRELQDPAEREQAEEAYRALTDLPQAEQRRRMARARESVLDCRGDDLLPILSQDAR